MRQRFDPSDAPHCQTGSRARAEWLARMVDGVVTDDGRRVLGPDGVRYHLKRFLVGYVNPGERVRFVPRDGLWAGVPWAAEVWRAKRNGRFPHNPYLSGS